MRRSTGKGDSSDNSLGSEDTVDMHRLSNFETQLGLVQRDMIRVLNLPTEVDTDAAPVRASPSRVEQLQLSQGQQPFQPCPSTQFEPMT